MSRGKLLGPLQRWGTGQSQESTMLRGLEGPLVGWKGPWWEVRCLERGESRQDEATEAGESQSQLGRVGVLPSQ